MRKRQRKQQRARQTSRHISPTKSHDLSEQKRAVFLTLNFYEPFQCVLMTETEFASNRIHKRGRVCMGTELAWCSDLVVILDIIIATIIVIAIGMRMFMFADIMCQRFALATTTTAAAATGYLAFAQPVLHSCKLGRLGEPEIIMLTL